jgi:hypothetical protein
MKREISGWVVAGLLGVLMVSMGAMQQTAQQAGRFQITSLMQPMMITRDSDGKEVVSEQRITILLDTETGEARQLIYTVNADGMQAAWTAPFTLIPSR